MLLHFGGLGVTTLLDSGATCNAMPEEVLITILTHLKEKGQEKLYGPDNPYPLTRLYHYTNSAPLDGIAAGATMSVCYGASFEVEFRGVGTSKGPKTALHFKIFPKGKCEIPGVLIGFPALDTVPHGLGHRVQQTVHVFDALGVSLPRLELDKKEGSCAMAIIDAPDYLLSPGDEAMVPIIWDRQVPDTDSDVCLYAAMVLRLSQEYGVEGVRRE